MTLGLPCNRSVRESKAIRLLLIIHSGIILDLVCVFSVGFGSVVFVDDVRADFSRRGEKSSFFCRERVVVRSDDSA